MERDSSYHLNQVIQLEIANLIEPLDFSSTL